MRFTGLLCILAPLTFAVLTTAGRADDLGVATAAPAVPAVPATAAAPAPTAPAAASGEECCECCGPGTNPWDGTVKAGFGLRMSDNYVTQQTGATSNTYNFFNPDDARIYLSGSAFGGKIKGTLNTEITSVGAAAPGGPEEGAGTFVSPNNISTVNLLDGIAQFEFSDKLNFWAGRFLPPTDRANLDGPFYQTPYDYPFVSNYPSLLAGRDDGAAYWGQAGGGKLKWQFGMFNGIGRNYIDATGAPVGPNATGNYMYIGRVTVNLLDPEPGYYTQSCYFGEKEILAIGMTAAFQRDGGGTAASPADFNAQSIDLLWEHRVSTCGVIDFESAFYKYDYGFAGFAPVGIAPVIPAGAANQGTSEYFQLSYLLPQNICFCGVSGKLQPFVRYQNYAYDFKAAAAGQFNEGVDIGVNYVISGYNARTTVAWGQRDVVGGNTFEFVRTGIQLQF